jgi:hypothetical protein
MNRGADATENRIDKSLQSHDQDSSALARQQELNQGKQRHGINSEAGLKAEFGDNRQRDLGGADFGRDSTQLGADRQTLSRDQGWSQAGQAQAGMGANQSWGMNQAGAGQQNQFGSSNQASGNLASDNLRSNQQSWDKQAQMSSDLLSKDRELTRNIADLARTENTTDHLATWNTARTGTDRSANAEGRDQMAGNASLSSNPYKEVGGTDHLGTGWARAPENRDFQTEKSANALSRDQMAGADANASYRTTTNPDNEVGGHDHLQARWDRAPDIRDFQTDKSANALSRDQLAGANANASYQTTTNPGQEVGGFDHLKHQANWDNGIEHKAAHHTDTSANTMNRGQMSMGTTGMSANQGNTTNPQKEVGGTDHLSQNMSAGYDTQAQNRNFRS